MGLDGGTDAGEDEKKKKINEDVMVFLRKRSETEAPRYTARLKTYVDLHHKRRRAAAARHHSEQILRNERSTVKKKNGENNKTMDTTENRAVAGEERTMKRRVGEKAGSRVVSRSPSGEPTDGCGRRRRRRRSCRRKKRRRRRSCSRRRRRRSCRRRRKKCRRRKRRC